MNRRKENVYKNQTWSYCSKMPWLSFLLNGVSLLIHFSCNSACGCVKVAHDKKTDTEFAEMLVAVSGVAKCFPEFKPYV